MGNLYFYQKNGRTHGPFTSYELRELAAAGDLSGDDLIRTQDMEKWKAAYKIKNLFAAEKGPPPVPVGAAPLPEKLAPPPSRASGAAPVSGYTNLARPTSTRASSVPPGLPPSGLRALAERGAAYFQLPLLPFIAGVVGVVCLLLFLLATLLK